HTRFPGDWSSDVCSSDLGATQVANRSRDEARLAGRPGREHVAETLLGDAARELRVGGALDVTRTVRLNRPPDDEKVSALSYLRHNGAIVGARRKGQQREPEDARR